MAPIVRINSISQIHQMFGLPPSAHPLITIIKEWPEVDIDFSEIKITGELYLIGLKGNIGGSFGYGRNAYDFEEGTLVFMAPNQVAQFDNDSSKDEEGGWTLFFHPDLLRKSELGKMIKEYSFFFYDSNESLHVSDQEKEMLNDLVERIGMELNQTADKHSHDIILSNLDSILKYCSRYYDRQFSSRKSVNKDYIVRFEHFLKEYFASDELSLRGMPSVVECGHALNISGSYLSDLLKLETGRSAKDHIYDHLIDKAKNILLSSDVTVGQVAYELGFEYPQHFSNLFKSKTGFSPLKFRTSQ